MNKLPFVIIGCLIAGVILLAVFASREEKTVETGSVEDLSHVIERSQVSFDDASGTPTFLSAFPPLSIGEDRAVGLFSLPSDSSSMSTTYLVLFRIEEGNAKMVSSIAFPSNVSVQGMSLENIGRDGFDSVGYVNYVEADFPSISVTLAFGVKENEILFIGKPSTEVPEAVIELE